jgi:hypothetical protein
MSASSWRIQSIKQALLQSEVAAVMYAGYIFLTRRKKWSKYTERFRHSAYSTMTFSMEDGSGFKNFVMMTKM